MTTFPDIPLDIRIEVNAGGTWTDLSARNDHPPVVITRGHPDESATLAPSTVDFELTNSDGALSPDNPTSPLWPWLLQNIPGRVSIAEGASYLRNETDQASGASSGLLAAPADIDAQVDLTLDSGWTQTAALVSQWASAGNDRCWFFGLNPDGTLQWGMSADGTMGTYQGAASTLPAAPPPTGRMSARVTWNHATGAVTFYTSTTPVNASPSWTQLGTAVTLTPASPFATATAIQAGMSANTDFTFTPYTAAWPAAVTGYPGFYGKCHGVRLLTGATVKASPDFTVQTAGAASFTDSAGLLWTVQGTAVISDRNYRCHAELSEWPQDEPPVNPGDGTHIDATVKVAGGGLLRRLGQRNRPVNSAMYRASLQFQAAPGLAACWPMEDAAGSQSLASIASGPVMTFSGTPALASSSAFPGANPLPVTAGASFTGKVSYAGTWTDNDVRWLMEIPSAGEPDGTVAAVINTTGAVATATVTYSTASGGGLTLRGYDKNGGLTFTTTAFTNVNGVAYAVQVYLQAGGSASLTLLPLGSGTSAGHGGTFLSGQVGAVTSVTLNPDGGLTGTVFGYLTVLPFTTDIAGISGPMAGWNGEPAGWRMSRLCGEEGIPFRARGNLAATTLMGVQSPQTLASLMQQCADADLGIWTELRQALGWGYVTRQALYNQAAIVAADYHQDHLSPWVSPPQRDDQYIVNDVTYANADGSSARQFAGPGQLIPGGRFATGTPGGSTPSPGTYDQSYPVSVAYDSDLNNLAGWRLHLGTVDQARFPGVLFDLSNRDLAGQMAGVLAMDLGHRFTIGNPPLRWGAGSVTQLAQQLTETLGPYELTVAATGVPELPYQVLQAGGAVHIDTDGTTLASAVTSSATGLGFVTAAGFPLWTTAAADFPQDVMISGERVTVSAIAAAAAVSVAVADGTFDVSGITDWTAAGGTGVSLTLGSSPHTGTHAASVKTASGGSQVTLRPAQAFWAPAVPGVSYTAGAWVEDFNADSAQFCCSVDWYTAAGTYISTSAGTASNPGVSTYAQFTVTATAPAAAAWAAPGPTRTGTLATADNWEADDITITVPAQTATVTRSVNGVVKAQAAGTAVQAWPGPPAIGL